MKRLTATVAVVLLLAVGTQAQAGSNSLCKRLREYAAAPYPETLDPRGRRWIEFHWTGKWLGADGWGKHCRFSADPASKELCNWMVGDTPYEFGRYQLFSILECYGYRFPRPFPDWYDWKSKIQLLDHGRWIEFEIDLDTPSDTESGMFRFSVFDKEFDPALAELPELAPLPAEPVKQD